MRTSFTLLHSNLSCWRVWTAFIVKHDGIVTNNIDVIESGARRSSSTLTRAAHRFEASFINQTVTADTACPNNCCCFDEFIAITDDTPSGVHSLIAVPILKVTPLSVKNFHRILNKLRIESRQCCRSCFNIINLHKRRITSNSLQSTGIRSASSPINSIPVNPAPPTTNVR